MAVNACGISGSQSCEKLDPLRGSRDLSHYESSKFSHRHRLSLPKLFLLAG
jgi:hypothetical protein